METGVFLSTLSNSLFPSRAVHRSSYVNVLAVTKTSEYFLFLLIFLFVFWLFVILKTIFLFNEKINLKETAKRNFFIHKEQNLSLSKSHTH